MKDLPETTLTLLNAVRETNGTIKAQIYKVIISPDGHRAGIDYLPAKTQQTSEAIARAGISDLVQRYGFPCTRPSVQDHFRPGVYDISGPEIKILK